MLFNWMAVRKNQIVRLLVFSILLTLFFLLVLVALRTIPATIKQLFVYTLLSLSRIAAAYVISLIAALVIGFRMATSRRFEKIMLPLLDILQSVPVVGFFPAAIAIFVALFNGERIGIELASIFLIFTSLAWNMIFGVYESIKTIPKDILRLSKALNLKGSLALRKVYLPATVPSLVYNSMVSWANSWFFLMASEVFAIGAKRFELPGLGFYLWKASEAGRPYDSILGLLMLIVVVTAMSLFVWEPLSDWSRKFSYQMLPYGEEKPVNYVLSRFRDITLAIRLNRAYPAISHALARIFDAVYRFFVHEKNLIGLARKLISLVLKLASLAATAAAIFYSVRFFIDIFSRPLPAEAALILPAIFVSLARLVVTYIFCLGVLFFIVQILYFYPSSGNWLLTILRLLSSIPGTAFQPIILALFTRYSSGNPMAITSIFVLFSTMLWYLIFPVAGRVFIIPREFKEPVTLFSSRSKLFIFRKLIFPAAFPGFVTGSLAAFGAGWNALVVAEFSVFNGVVYQTFGIGSLIDRAAYIQGDMALLTLCLTALVVTIIILNKAVWQPLYNLAERRYTMEVD